MKRLIIRRNARIFQYLAMITGNLSIVSSGMHYGWPSPSLPQLQRPNSTFHVANHEGSWLAAMPLVGAAIGALMGIALVDRIGRKATILLTALPFFGAWLAVGFARAFPVLLLARLVAGIGDGICFCALPIYLNEIAEPEVRGLLGSSCSVTLVLGMLLINIVGSYTSIKTAALISSAVPLMLFVTFIWMPESPYFLTMRGREAEAAKSLRVFKGVNDVDEDMERISNAITEQNTETGRFLDLFTVKSNRKAVLIAMGGRTMQQCSGMLAISFYAHTIFESAGSSVSSSMTSIIYFAVQLLMCIVSSALVDRTGRRPLLVFSLIGAGIALFIEGTYFYLQSDHPSLDVSRYSYVPIVVLFAFVIMYSVGLQTVPVLLLGELFPTNVKAFALSLVDINFSLVATAVSKFFQAVKDHYGMHIPFFSFGVACVVGLVFVICCVPETKGKTLEEIQEELKGSTANDTRQVESLRRVAVATIDICSSPRERF
ncbi:facilitated trehalose transporter Tret1-like [Photinus pyralis]|nr:facilitated trehalose transporter Tret1-like [Photinus pyralis]XP_031356505.1 facilitated trehalose transporter Tret1-like [Photinus pyralis]